MTRQQIGKGREGSDLRRERMQQSCGEVFEQSTARGERPEHRLGGEEGIPLPGPLQDLEEGVEEGEVARENKVGAIAPAASEDEDE